jgi:hypothetical protein
MAVLVVLDFPVTPEQYDEARRTVRWEEEAPAGGMFHVAAATEGGMQIVDVWESADDFNRFVEERLMPGLQSIGITAQPTVKILPAHRIFTPGYNPK